MPVAVCFYSLLRISRVVKTFVRGMLKHYLQFDKSLADTMVKQVKTKTTLKVSLHSLVCPVICLNNRYF